MPWFYFARRGDDLFPVSPRRLPARPRDANPPNGDPLTPWYENMDHYDADHAHVFAEDLDEALRRAQSLLGKPVPL